MNGDYTIRDVYLINTHPYSFRAGIPGKITGIIFKYSGSSKRLCYEVTWDDHVVDYTSVSDNEHYRLASFPEIVK